MSVSPAPARAVARDIADQIIERRTKAHDPRLADLGDTLEEVVAHIGATRDRTGRDLLGLDDQLDPEMVRADVTDAFAVLDYLTAHYARQVARWRVGLYEAARRAGMGPTALMGPMHQRHRQGVIETIKRDRALLNPHVDGASPDDARQLAERGQANTEATRTAGDELRALAETLVDLRLALPPDLEDATGFDADDLAGAIGYPEMVPILRLVVRHVLAAPVTDELRDVLDHTYAHLVEQLVGQLGIRPASALPGGGDKDAAAFAADQLTGQP